MGWDDSAPTKQELGTAGGWDAAPPRASELEHHSWLSRTANAAVDMLPAGMAAVGGGLGLIEGGVGAFPGSAIGGAAGVGARNVIRGIQNEGLGYFTRTPTVSGSADATVDLGKGAFQGVSQELGARTISGALKSFAGSGVTDVSKDALNAAATRLGITPTTGMLSKDYTTRGMESSLEHSPTVGGYLTRSETMPVRQRLSDATENLLKDATDETRYGTGVNISQGVSSKLAEKYNNVQMAYENFNQELPKMAPELTAKAKLADDVANATKGNLSFNLPENWGETVSNKVMNAKSLADLEDVRHQVGDALTSAYSAGDRNAISAISKVQDHLSDFRDNQFVELAKQNYPGQGGRIGKQMADEYQAAQSQYHEMMNDLKEVGPIFGIKSKNPKAFIDALQNIPPEKMADKLFTPNNIDKLNVVSQYFPEEFQQVKSLKLAQIKAASQSVVNGESVIDPSKFLRQVGKLQPEVQTALFGENVSTINDIKTVAQSFPAKIGPSGTPEGNAFMEKFDLGEIPRQATSLGQRAFLNMRGSPLVQTVVNSPVTQAAGNLGIGAVGTMLNPGPSVQPRQPLPSYSDGGYVQPPPPPPPTYIDPERAKSVQDSMRKAFHFAAGGMVPGAPQVPVNSPQNDTVLGKLSPGEVVLPLSVTQSSNPPQRAKEFMANQQMGPTPNQQTVQQDPKTGPIKWANDGFNNLKSHVNDKDRKFLEENKAKIMVDQKSQNLLVSASQFSPGTKPLDDIIKHLKNRLK